MKFARYFCFCIMMVICFMAFGIAEEHEHIALETYLLTPDEHRTVCSECAEILEREQHAFMDGCCTVCRACLDPEENCVYAMDEANLQYDILTKYIIEDGSEVYLQYKRNILDQIVRQFSVEYGQQVESFKIYDESGTIAIKEYDCYGAGHEVIRNRKITQLHDMGDSGCCPYIVLMLQRNAYPDGSTGISCWEEAYEQHAQAPFNQINALSNYDFICRPDGKIEVQEEKNKDASGKRQYITTVYQNMDEAVADEGSTFGSEYLSFMQEWESFDAAADVYEWAPGVNLLETHYQPNSVIGVLLNGYWIPRPLLAQELYSETADDYPEYMYSDALTSRFLGATLDIDEQQGQMIVTLMDGTAYYGSYHCDPLKWIRRLDVSPENFSRIHLGQIDIDGEVCDVTLLPGIDFDYESGKYSRKPMICIFIADYRLQFVSGEVVTKWSMRYAKDELNNGASPAQIIQDQMRDFGYTEEQITHALERLGVK